MAALYWLFIASIAAPVSCNNYIVVLNSSVAADDRSQHMEFLASMRSANVIHDYTIGSFVGYAASLDVDSVHTLRSRPEVITVEQDISMHQHAGTCNTEQNAPSWGIQRVSATKQPLDGTYTYKDEAGKDVDIYVIDAGVRVTHKDFGGRARFGANVAGGTVKTDPDGHGTHCAGIAASKTYGICKACNIISVIAFDDAHHCSASTIIAGFDWVLKNVKSGSKSVISISLGGDSGETSDAMDSAISALVAAGVHVVSSAGNYLGDACLNSPARAASAVTVSSTSNEFAGQDYFAAAANFGKCVNILAPGDVITSLGHNSDTEVGVVMSGTSMATPHVAGVMAMLASTNPSMTLPQVQDLMYKKSLSGLVQLLPKDTPNKLLHNPCTSEDTVVV